MFPLPSYQSTAVKNFFANHPPPYTAAQYNNSQQTRGFPDISANGANYVVAVDGTFSLVYGTSASSPVVGSIITLINEARFAIGKSSVGFINPTLYANPGALFDITQGGNQGCVRIHSLPITVIHLTDLLHRERPGSRRRLDGTQ